MNNLRVSFQQWDNDHKVPAKAAKIEQGDIRANQSQVKPGEKKPVDEAAKEKFIKEVKGLGLWVDPQVYKGWSQAQRDEHSKKVKAARKVKKATTTPPPSTPPAATTPAPAAAPTQGTTFAQAAAQPVNNGEDLAMMQDIQGRYPNGAPAVFPYNGRVYRSCAARRMYKVSGDKSPGSLVDGGCNGGLAGNDVLIMGAHSVGTVDIVGVADNLIKDVPLCTTVSIIQTDKGPVMAFMHNYAALGSGPSIHSPTQMRDHGVLIDDTPRKQKRFDGKMGTQSVIIPSLDSRIDYKVDLTITGGLAYFEQRPPTDAELNDLGIPHVHLTSDMPWHPEKYDDDREATEPPGPF